jgi:hypothetical protein
LYQRKLVHRLLVYQRTTVSVYIETEWQITTGYSWHTFRTRVSILWLA